MPFQGVSKACLGSGIHTPRRCLTNANCPNKRGKQGFPRAQGCILPPGHMPVLAAEGLREPLPKTGTCQLLLSVQFIQRTHRITHTRNVIRLSFRGPRQAGAGHALSSLSLPRLSVPGSPLGIITEAFIQAVRGRKEVLECTTGQRELLQVPLLLFNSGKKRLKPTGLF